MAKLKVDGREYEVPSFTLGEFRELKRDFGVESISTLNPDDPDQLVGLVYMTIRRVRPGVTVEEIERLDRIEFTEDDEAVPPTSGGADSNGASPSETTLVSSGSLG